MNLFHLIHMSELTCFRSSHQTPFYEIDTLWYRNRRSAKLCERVQFCYAYSSTKGKLLLKYFIRKIIWKYTSNSWWLLLILLKKSLHSEKKRQASRNHVEIMLALKFHLEDYIEAVSRSSSNYQVFCESIANIAKVSGKQLCRSLF